MFQQNLCGLAHWVRWDALPEGSKRKLPRLHGHQNTRAWAGPEIMNSDLDKLYSNEHC